MDFIKHEEKGRCKIEQSNVNRLERKRFNIFDVNLPYYEAFLNRFEEKSRRTYKVSVGRFLENLGPHDFAQISSEMITTFANTSSFGQQRNVMSHLRSMLSFVIQNNINGAAEKVQRETLIWLLDKKAAKNVVSKSI